MSHVRILSFLGELDETRRAWIEGEIALPSNASDTTFIIDLSGVTGIDAALLKNIARPGSDPRFFDESTVVVVGHGRKWIGLLLSTRLDTSFKLFFDIGSALKHVRSRAVTPLRIEQQLVVTRGSQRPSWPAANASSAG